MMRKIVFLFVSLVLMSGAFGAGNFSTGGNGIRNCIDAKVDGRSVLYISEVDGALSCHAVSGEKLWRNPSRTPAVMFELVAADIDGDGSDDLLAASGDGHVYAWKSDGCLLWKFNPGHKVRFNEVAVMEGENGLRIFAGGNDYHLYELDMQGTLVSARPIGGSVRKLEAGDFIEEGVSCLFLYTLNHDKYRSEFFGFIDPNHFREVVRVTTLQDLLPENGDRFMLQDLSVADLNKDGRDDLVLVGAKGQAIMAGIDGEFNRIATFYGPETDGQRYAHCIGIPLLPCKDEVVLQYGGVMYRVDLKGTLLSRSGMPHRGIIYNDLVCEATSGQLIGAGQVGGGNGLYFYPLKKRKWWEAEQVLQGRMAEVEDNLNRLYRQALQFELPGYQKKSNESYHMITGISRTPEVEALDGGEIRFIKQLTLSEGTDRSGLVDACGEIALQKDWRKDYNLSRGEVVELARSFEDDGQPFVIWAGHGTDPFYLQIETLEQILDAAPNMCHGFLYAEIHNPEDPRVIHWAGEYLPRIAKAIRKNGSPAKLYFRYKSMFWAATVHSSLWKDIFFSGKYSDILVPSAEDTNNRLQDLNFSGRVGMFAGGYVEDYAIRLVDDNPTSWRPYSPGGQRSVSPYLRNGALLASYGARYGILFGIRYLEKPGMNILFALMQSGVIPVVEKEDLLSIGSWHLVKDVNMEVVHKADSGHNLINYEEEDLEAVVAVNSVTWCGANVPDYDYSKVSLGIGYRWLNFMPEMPNGMVPVAPVEMAPRLDQAGAAYCISNMKSGFVNGKEVSAHQFGPVMKEAVQTGGNQMLLKVTGASWSLIRIDKKHARLVLVDPGYIDPQERKVTVTLQGLKPVKAVNILSGENIPVTGDELHLTVPAGSLRFVDLEYAGKI